MANVGTDAVIVRLAVYCIVASMLSGLLVGLLVPGSDAGTGYDADEISEYQTELGRFTGDSLTTDTPWVLTHVYTPYVDGSPAVDDDGYAYGEAVAYPYIGSVAGIRLDPDQKSSVPLEYENADSSGVTQEVQRSSSGHWYSGILNWWYGITNQKSSEGVALLDYTGYRYVFDPTKIFKYDDTKDLDSNKDNYYAADGSLSLVWYAYGTEGLSGALTVYHGSVRIGSITAASIVAGYNQSSGYASSFDVDFEGTVLKISIKFDPAAVQTMSLSQAWVSGLWSMSVSSESADGRMSIDDSHDFSTSLGGIIRTLRGVFTFSLPDVGASGWGVVLWIMVYVPGMLGLVLVGIRAIELAKPLG